jgi:uncharacterized membrane protein
MLHHRITKRELLQVQIVLLAAIALQLATRHIGNALLPGSQYLIILIELGLALLIAFTVNRHKSNNIGIHHILAVILIGLISAANISGLVYVLQSLIVNHASLSAEQLLAAAIPIFVTNIIVYALWYWEIDSPGLTRTHWSKHEKDFQFTQQDLEKEFPAWEPQFLDYLFLSVSNAVNFAPADTRPLTHQAKMLMSSQSLISVFTLALVVARSVSVLG